MAADNSFSLSTVVRGYHVYKHLWEAAEGETLPCRCERTNLHDPFAVAITKNDETVGHVPRRFSAACSLFFRRNGVIVSRVTGSRKYSTDLPQGGLEIPCILTFTGIPSEIHKLKKILDVAGGSNKSIDKILKPLEDAESKPVKKRRMDDDDEYDQTPWVRINSTLSLSKDDYDILSGGMELTDNHMNASQMLLKAQFPSIRGLGLTYAPPRCEKWVENYAQVIHCRSNHWSIASTIGCTPGTVHIYDSLYDDIDDVSKNNLQKILGSPLTFSFPSVQKQIGTVDCLQSHLPHS